MVIAATARNARPESWGITRPVVPSRAIRLQVIDSFRLTVNGADADVALPAQRLLVLLAIRHRALVRGHVAGTLWLDHSESRAAGNLRSVLWRLRTQALPIVESRNGTIELAPAVSVDLHEAAERAQRWLAGTETDVDRAAGPSALEGEVLPDWYDDWISDERERFRQLRLHALEAMAERLAAAGRWADAVLAAMSALAADPLRESAHRAVIKVHLAEGNVAEAVRQLRRCERLMIDEVGVPPSAQLAELIPMRAR